MQGKFLELFKGKEVDNENELSFLLRMHDMRDERPDQ